MSSVKRASRLMSKVRRIRVRVVFGPGIVLHNVAWVLPVAAAQRGRDGWDEHRRSSKVKIVLDELRTDGELKLGPAACSKPGSAAVQV
jgi:hypothetical protein